MAAESRRARVLFPVRSGRTPGRRGRLAPLGLLVGALAACTEVEPPRLERDAPEDGRPDPPPSMSGCPGPEARPSLVRVGELAPTIREEIRYATDDNFTGSPLPGYEVPAALLRPEAAEALARVQDHLEERGLGLLVWDGYRPVRATRAMVEWAERTGNVWVLDQGYVARRSNHNRGNTVDLTLLSLETGRPLDMGTPYDHFGPRAHTANAEGAVLRNRRLLLEAMEAEGWENYAREWWHFTHPSDDDFLDVPIGCYLDRAAAGV